jgi:hypothetical protein
VSAEATLKKRFKCDFFVGTPAKIQQTSMAVHQAAVGRHAKSPTGSRPSSRMLIERRSPGTHRAGLVPTECGPDHSIVRCWADDTLAAIIGAGGQRGRPETRSWTLTTDNMTPGSSVAAASRDPLAFRIKDQVGVRRVAVALPDGERVALGSGPASDRPERSPAGLQTVVSTLKLDGGPRRRPRSPCEIGCCVVRG